MTHAGHKVVKCAACESVIAQCRCFSPNKPVYYQPGPCVHCRAAKDASINATAMPQTGEVPPMVNESPSIKRPENDMPRAMPRPERLTEAEVAAIRERWEATERRIVQREAAAKRAGVMGDRERLNRPPGHEDIPRLLATLEAERARAAALVGAGDAVCQRFEAAVTWFEPATHDFYLGVVKDWRALTRGGDDERA